MRGINRVSGPPSFLVWVSDDIRDAGGEADWLSCSFFFFKVPWPFRRRGEGLC